MSDIKKRIGERIKAIRIAKGLTQEEAGSKLGLTQSTFANYEAGRQNFSVEVLERVAKSLDVELVDLIM
ncbi:helix-turn-helix domain-containing protein [Fibrella forsythiae]|uniref:Helix-turn-helix transcriptional regulator n=1 Tax=Fibrella forsythiae TaxID=2817061 RepID=A0ABS3JB72_9BACT|nr:helix-turn-helix transcriptional regulator [Fibrella forsythiae]